MDTKNLTGHAQVLEELQSVSGGSTNVARKYVYGHDLIAQITSVSTNYYGYDGQGTVRFLTSAAGSLTDTYTYDAFGILIYSSGTTPNNYLYTGEQYDPNLGFYYLRARYIVLLQTE